jgi:transposase
LHLEGMKKHHVSLTPVGRQAPLSTTRSGTHPARVLLRARAPLPADDGADDLEVVQASGTSHSTVQRARRRAAKEGLESALFDRPRPGAAPELDGRQRAHLAAIACTDPPAGRERWTLRLLAAELPRRGLGGAISHEAVRRVLKKVASSRGSRSAGACRG